MSIIAEREIKELRRYYNNIMYQELKRMERKRILLLFVFFLVFLIILVGIYLAVWVQVFALSLFILIPFGYLLYWMRGYIRRFVNGFKPHIIRSILYHIDPQFKYLATDFIPQDTFLRSRLFGESIDYYHGEDYIRGKVGNTNFETCQLDVRSTSEVHSGLDILFKGLFFHAPFHFQFSGTLIILPAHRWTHHLRTIKAITRLGGTKVALPHPELQEHFVAYADKGMKIKDLLTPVLLENILEYQTLLGKDVYLSFVNSHFYIGIYEPYDILEPNIFFSNQRFDLMVEFYKDLRLLTGLAESLETL